MQVTAVSNTNFQAKIKLSKANVARIINSDKAKLATGGGCILTGTGSFLLGLDSWNWGVDSGVAEKIYDSALEQNATPEEQYNTVFANTISYAMANSTLSGPLASSTGLERIWSIKDKKIPD